MQKKLILFYLILCCFILAMFGLLRQKGDKIRGGFLSFFAKGSEKLLVLKDRIIHPTEPSPFTTLSPSEKIEQLTSEKHLLEDKIKRLESLLIDRFNLNAELERRSGEEEEKRLSKAEVTRERSFASLDLRTEALPARVIFRSLDLWNRSLWINSGSSINQGNAKPLLAKNSPVVIGKSIIGVIDYVGEDYSRIRLITDSTLNPSVRVVRGGENELFFLSTLSLLSDQLTLMTDGPFSENEKKEALEIIERLKSRLAKPQKSLYLAKGELLGSIDHLRGQDSLVLRGSGFNYDFPDEEGEARDLSTGQLIGSPDSPCLPLIKENDLLMTTGMDGVFPPGFYVARVTKVNPLSEEDYYYTIEATPTAPLLEEMTLVFVLPPYATTNPDFFKNAELE